ncbi:MAG: DNA-protecting protein DprA [Gemmatimonadetes bacterium]|nr:DNA-protecting protein DprA [Gemmatimonadota bacterium]
MESLTVDAGDLRAEARALLLLQRLPGLADVGVRRLVDTFGSGRAALAAPDQEMAAALGQGEPRPAGLAAARARGASEDGTLVADALERCDALGAAVVPMTAPEYPRSLLDLGDPPPVVFLRGRAELLALPAVALVGSRRATGYGRRTSARLARGVARSGAVVLSGLALGVDGEAHRGALEVGGATVAVLGTGPDVIHPASHGRLFRSILETGLVVSEFAPGTPPLAHHFPRRNRIMAALARVVVVVEAAARSGALITARHALDLGMDVLAVPGPIDAPTSVGANELLRDGAHPVLGPEEILRALGLPVTNEASLGPAPDTDAAALWEALSPAPEGVDALASRTGLPPRRALAALSSLELEGWAVQSAGARFARRT